MQTFHSFLAKWLNLFISIDIINKSWIMKSVGHVIKSCESQRAFQYIMSIVIQVLSLWSMCLIFWNKIIWIWTGGFFLKNIYSLITEKKSPGYIYSDPRHYECVFTETILLSDKYVLIYKMWLSQTYLCRNWSKNIRNGFGWNNKW